MQCTGSWNQVAEIGESEPALRVNRCSDCGELWVIMGSRSISEPNEYPRGTDPYVAANEALHRHVTKQLARSREEVRTLPNR